MGHYKYQRQDLIASFMLLPTFGFIAIFAFYPIIYSFWLSLHRIILGLPQLGEDFIGLNNYVALLHDRVALRAIINTFIFVLISTMAELLIGLMIALIIHRSFRGRGLVRAAVLVPWAIPTVVSSQLWRFIFNDKYGLLNYILFGTDLSEYRAWLAEPLYAFVAIIVADVWKTSSFAALLLLAGLQSIPQELYEAAKVDGAGPLQRFRHITLPMLKPAILVTLLFRTMDAFRVFDLVFVMTQGGPADATNVLQFYGYKKIFAEGLMGYGSSISVVVFVISFVVTMIYLKTIKVSFLQARR